MRGSSWNHFHAVVQTDDLPRVMADLKKFTAGKLRAQFEAERRAWLLDLLAAGKAAHKTRSTWQLWQEGYHPQAVCSGPSPPRYRRSALISSSTLSSSACIWPWL